MIWCVQVRRGNQFGWRISTFRPAAWLLPLLVSPAVWLQGATWDNKAGSSQGAAGGITYTAAAGTVTLKQTTSASGVGGTLEILSANPTQPGYATFTTSLPGTTGWVRINADANVSSRYEFAQLYQTGQITLGMGQGNYTAVPASSPAPMQPATPIASTVAAFSVSSGGAITQQSGSTFNGGRIQNLLTCNGSNCLAYSTQTGASGDAGFNPLSPVAVSPSLAAGAFGPQPISLIAWPDGTAQQAVTAQYLLAGTGAAFFRDSTFTAITSQGANTYSYYSNASVAANGVTLAQGETVELQGALTVSGALNGTSLSTMIIGGHGSSPSAGLILNNGAGLGPALTVLVQENPLNTLPITVAGTATLNNSLVLTGGSKVALSGQFTINLARLDLWSGSSLNVTSAVNLTSASTILGGSLSGASGTTFTLGPVEVPSSNSSSLSVPVGTINMTSLNVAQTGSLALSTGTLALAGNATLNGSLSLTASTAATLSGTTSLGQGAQLSLAGAAPTTVTILSTTAGGGLLSKAAVAGTVTVNTVSLSTADALSVVQNGTDAMTLGATGGVNLTGGGTLNLSGTGPVSINALTGGAGTLSLSGSGTRTFTGAPAIQASNALPLTIQTSASNPLTIPATTAVQIDSPGNLGLSGPITFLPPLNLAAGRQLTLLGGGVVVNQLTLSGGSTTTSNSLSTINNLALAANASDTGTGTLQLGTVSGGNSYTSAGTVVLTGGSSLTGAGTKIVAANLRLTGNPILGAGTLLEGNPQLEIAASLNQNLAVNQISASNLLFSASSTLTGSGTIAVTSGAASSIKAASPAVVTMAGIDLSSAGGTTIDAGASLGGVGTLTTSAVTVDGTLFAGNPIGTLNVTGPVTFASTGRYTSAITSAGVGLLDVTGTATLAGNLTVTLTGTRAPIGTVFTVLQATSVAGTFNSTGGRAGVLTFETIYTPTEVRVAVIYPPNGICGSITPCTAAQAVGCAIDQIVAEQCYGPVFEDFLYNEIFYPVSSPFCVLQQLAGGPYTDLPQLAGLQLMASQDVLRSAEWMALDRWDGCGHHYAWINPTGDEVSSTSWRFRAAGVQAGYEKIWSSGWGLGIVGMAEAVSLESKTCTMKGHGGNFGVSPILTWVPTWRSGYWRSYVWASGTVSGLVTSLRRGISWTGFCCEASSDWDPINVSGRIEGGLTYTDCTMSLQPFAALSAFKVGAGSIQEEACCPAGLDVGCWQDSFGLAEVGFRWREGLCWMNTSFAPELDMGVYVVTWGRGSEMSAKFQEAPCACWSLCGPQLSRYGAFGGVGLQGFSSDRLTIGMRIDGRFAKEYTAWIGTAQVMWRF